MGRVGTTSARALVILIVSPIVSLIVSVVFRDIVRLVVDGVTGLLGIVDLGEDLLDLLKGSGALDLERRNTSKERGKGERYYRGLTVMGNSAEPDGGGLLRMLGRTDQTVEMTLEEEEK